MVKTSGFALVNGVTMLLWPSRLPGWLPPSVLGIVSIICGVGIGAATFTPSAPSAPSATDAVPFQPLVAVGRVCLAILACLCLVATIGLYLGWDPTPSGSPGAVPGSLDRVLMYGYVALMSVEVLREPTSNPVSARRQRKG